MAQRGNSAAQSDPVSLSAVLGAAVRGEVEVWVEGDFPDARVHVVVPDLPAWSIDLGTLDAVPRTVADAVAEIKRRWPMAFPEEGAEA
jgi:hypothetical protein